MDITTCAPQANRIETVVAVVDAIAAGCDTAASIGAGIGLSARQGGYYAHAARTLGYAHPNDQVSPTEWSLTQEGQALTDLDTPALVVALTQTLTRLPELDVLVATDGDFALEVQLGTDGYAGTTARRRKSTWSAWMDFATSPTATKLLALGAVKRDAATHAPAAAATRAAERRLAAKMTPTYGVECHRCFVTMPVTGTCDTCD